MTVFLSAIRIMPVQFHDVKRSRLGIGWLVLALLPLCTAGAISDTAWETGVNQGDKFFFRVAAANGTYEEYYWVGLERKEAGQIIRSDFVGLPFNEFFYECSGLKIGDLHRRVLEEVGADVNQFAANTSIFGDLQSPNHVNHDACGVW